ncbi:MAG: polysaccharide pyruvyl transferase family protein [Desulfuromonadaceae bacterium]|nr:polysaccharide pyruvyl transferase family protein [Desulfuromonas sp.]MDY0185171.1 polysaccharide pyruvyl transferase family protein [Desulfuromonadaceae bacterium]
MVTWINGYIGRHNVGDEAILASVLQHLPQNAKPVVFSSNPAHTRLVHGVRSLLLPPIDFAAGKAGLWYGKGYWARHGVELLLARLNVGGQIYCGGGMLNDHVPGRMVKRHATVRAMAKLSGNRPVAFLAVGADLMTRESDRLAARELIEDLVTYCSVRDQQSYQALLELGINPQRVHLAEDVVFAMKVQELPISTARVKSDLGINFRPLFDEAHNRDATAKHRAAYKARCIDLVAALSKEHESIALIPFGPDDFTFLSAIGATAGVPVEPWTDNPMAILQRVAQCRAFIGMRYHAVVFSLIAGVPCVPLVYAPKVGALGEQMGVRQELVMVGNGEEMPDSLFEVHDVRNILGDLMRDRQSVLRNYAALAKTKSEVAREDMVRCWQVLARGK